MYLTIVQYTDVSRGERFLAYDSHPASTSSVSSHDLYAVWLFALRADQQHYCMHADAVLVQCTQDDRSEDGSYIIRKRTVGGRIFLLTFESNYLT
jgi:hypothetical protein